MKHTDPPTCPFSTEPCCGNTACHTRCVRHTGPLPIDQLFADDPPPAVHFVGFRGQEFNSAVRVFGQPDFVHRHWDHRAQCDVMPGDTVVFAHGDENEPFPWSFDDSNQPDDPAAQERLEMQRAAA